MSRLSDWIAKLTGRHPPADKTEPRVDSFNPTKEDNAEEQQRLLKQQDAKIEQDPGRVDPNP